jgi:hypothetical protein
MVSSGGRTGAGREAPVAPDPPGGYNPAPEEPLSLIRALSVMLVLLLAAASFAAPARRHARTPRKHRPAAADTTRIPPVPDTLAVPVDTVARAWADSAISAHGGEAAWDSLEDLTFKVKVTQFGSGADRSLTSTRYLKLGPGGPMYRIEARTDSGVVFRFACTPAIAWAYEDDQFLEDLGATRFARNQLTLDLSLLGLPWKLRAPGVRLAEVGDVVESGREVHLLDVDLPEGTDLWRVSIDPGTRLVCGACWWHYERGGVPPRSRVELSEYVTVGRLVLPSLRRIYDGATGRLSSEARFTDFAANTGLADSLFRWK